jgi:hypothetical protein
MGQKSTTLGAFQHARHRGLRHHVYPTIEGSLTAGTLKHLTKGLSPSRKSQVEGNALSSPDYFQSLFER